MNKTKLLPCPFCGGKAIIKQGLDVDLDKMYYVACKKCFVKQWEHTNEQSAIQAWNTRKPMADIVEKLQKCSDEYKNSSDEYEQGKSFAYKNAINFVKAGDV